MGDTVALDFHDLERQHEEAASTEVTAKAADAALVLAFQQGDPLAFPAIYERYRPLARHIALRILRDPDGADEASQETMLRVYQGLSRFEGEYRLQAWVARIAANLALDAVRTRARRPARADEDLDVIARSMPDPAQDPEALVARMLEDADVRRVLATLPPHHRDALVMREFEGRSHAEIGAALGVTPPQAKALLHRAKVSFRRAWEAAGQGVAGFIPVLLWPLKRLSGHAVESASTALHGAQAAPTLYLVPQIAQTATSSGMAERVAAAGMAVLVAAGVGAGAVAVKNNVIDSPKKAPAVVAALDPSVDAAEPAVADGKKQKQKDEAVSGVAEGAPTEQGSVVEVAAPVEGTTTDGTDPVAGDVSPAPATPTVMINLAFGVPGCDGCTVAWGAPDTAAAGSLADGTFRATSTFVGTVAGAEGWSAVAKVVTTTSGGDGTMEAHIEFVAPDGTVTVWGATGMLEPLSDGGFSIRDSRHHIGGRVVFGADGAELSLLTLSLS